MADIISSLFGLTPIEQGVEDAARKRQFDLASLYGQATVNTNAPLAKQQAYINKQGAQGALAGMAVRGLGGLFGMKDEQLQRASDLESILSQTQQEFGNDPQAFYPNLQKRLAEAGYSREALQVGIAGQKEIQDSILSKAKLDTEQAQLLKAQRGEDYIVAGKNVFNRRTGQWELAPAGGKDGEDALSTDKKLSQLIEIYSNPNLPLADRNQAAIEANNLIPIVYKGEGNVPTLSEIKLQPGATPGDKVARQDLPEGTAISSPTISFKPVAGSKAEKQLTEEQAKALENYSTKLDSLASVKQSVADALALTSKGTTGWNSYGKYIPGSKAMALSDYIKNIKSNATLDTIKDMKEQSKTGATGFGALNLKELETIESAINVLNQTNDEKVVKQQLKLINDYFSKIEDKTNESYKSVTGQDWIPLNKRATFRFPKGYTPSSEQELQIAKAIKVVGMGKMTREEALKHLKESPYFQGVDVTVDMGAN